MQWKPTQETTRVNLRGLVLGERLKSQNITHSVIPFIQHSGKDKTVGAEFSG